MFGRVRGPCSVAACLAMLACAREPDDSTPQGALGRFLSALERSGQPSLGESPQPLEEVFHLLDAESRRRLVERARSASALAGRELAPWEMLVEERASLRFVPRRATGLRVRPGPDPDTAVVVVAGETGRAEVTMRREEDGWRVVLELPDAAAADARQPGP